MLFGVIMILLVFKIRVAPFSYEYDIRLILGANVQIQTKQKNPVHWLYLPFNWQIEQSFISGLCVYFDKLTSNNNVVQIILLLHLDSR